jgi:hypothetical protein
MFPVPTLGELATWSGRAENSYTGYANSALLQATLIFTTVTELGADDWNGLSSDDQLLATSGIMAYADWIYLRQPYQQIIASPMESETVGSYTYSKPFPVEARNVQAMELSVGLMATGIPLWDLAVQMLSRRTRAAGVFYGQIQVFERIEPRPDAVMYVRRDEGTGQTVLLGPADVDQIEAPFLAINAETFPVDPGVG